MGEKWENFTKCVADADLAAEMIAFGEEGFELVAAHPAIGGDNRHWGYTLFFKRRLEEE